MAISPAAKPGKSALVNEAIYIGAYAGAGLHKSSLKDLKLEGCHVVFWDIANYREEFVTDSVITSVEYQQASKGISKALDQLNRFVEGGGILVLFSTAAPQFSVYDVDVNVSSIAPLHEGLSTLLKLFAPKAGTRGKMDFTGPAHLKTRFDDVLSSLSHSYILGNASAAPFLVDHKSREAMGAYVRKDSGLVMMVPFMHSDDAAPYFEALAELGKTLAEQKHTPKPEGAEPAWSTTLYSGQEETLVYSNEVLEADVKKFLAQIKRNKEEIERFHRWNELVYSTGARFTALVKEAFEELGMAMRHGPDDYADLIGRYKDQIITFEAKGISGAARKSDISQAQSWGDEVEQALEFSAEERKDYHERYIDILNDLGFKTEQAGGKIRICRLIVLNTYRDTPLTERADPSFPDVAVNDMKTRNVSGLTGVQLFGLLLHTRENSDEREALVDELLKNPKPFGKFTKWAEFLKIRKP